MKGCLHSTREPQSRERAHPEAENLKPNQRKGWKMCIPFSTSFSAETPLSGHPERQVSAQCKKELFFFFLIGEGLPRSQ